MTQSRQPILRGSQGRTNAPSVAGGNRQNIEGPYSVGQTNVQDVLNSPGTHFQGPGVAWRSSWSPETPLQFGSCPFDPDNLAQPPEQPPVPAAAQPGATNPGADATTTEENQERESSPSDPSRDPLERFWQLGDDE